MKNTTLTVSFNTEKLDALTYHMGKKQADLPAELNDTIHKLYEKYVPQATREYLDDKIARDESAKESPPPYQWRNNWSVRAVCGLLDGGVARVPLPPCRPALGRCRGPLEKAPESVNFTLSRA